MHSMLTVSTVESAMWNLAYGFECIMDLHLNFTCSTAWYCYSKLTSLVFCFNCIWWCPILTDHIVRNGVLATLLITVAPQSAAFYLPNLVMAVQIAQHNHARVYCGGSHNVLYRNYPAYQLEPEVAVLRFTLGLTLREARQDSRFSFSTHPKSLENVPSKSTTSSPIPNCSYAPRTSVSFFPPHKKKNVSQTSPSNSL